MFLHQITNADIDYHNEKIRLGYVSSQRLISINGLREIIGNTFIQMGSNIRGKAKDVCQEVEAQRTDEHILHGVGALVR